MQEERTQAIVLRTRVHGESDKIVTFLTRDWGKVTGIAKGAKRSRRRFVNVLELFTHVALRFRPSRSDGLAFILGCDWIQTFRSPGQDLQKFACANYMAELADVMVAGREAGQETYLLLLHSLSALEDHPALPALFLPAFELRLLIDVGYAPNMTDCQLCGTALTPDDHTLAFSPSLSGLVCSQCTAQAGATFRLSPETLMLFQVWLASEQSVFPLPDISPRAAQETRTLVSRLLAQHLPRPLKSAAFLDQMNIFLHASIDDPQTG